MEKEIITYNEDLIKLARIAKALSHPARLQILNILSKQHCCYSGNIAGEFPIALSTLSQHLKELKEIGLIKGDIEGASVCYCIDEKVWNNAKKQLNQLFDNVNLSSKCC